MKEMLRCPGPSSHRGRLVDTVATDAPTHGSRAILSANTIGIAGHPTIFLTTIPVAPEIAEPIP